MTGRGAPAPRPFSSAGRLGFAVLLSVAVGAPAFAAAPVFEATPARQSKQDAPLLAPPGAIAQPTGNQAAAPDPLVSEIDPGADPDAQGSDASASSAPAGTDEAPRAAQAAAGSASYRAPSFASGSGSGGRRPSEDVPADSASVLFGQLQDLQQEVMMLRGVVETQQQTIDRLERESKERYLDLDRRLSRIGSGGAAPAGASVSPADASSAAAMSSGDGAGGERAAYEKAFGLTRDKQFDQAIPAFRKLIEDYPGGQYVPNAWYWLGELYLALPDPKLEQARQAFVQVVDQYPDNRKAPDALYKLGVVYDRLGEKDQARQYLERVGREHPGSPAAKLASSYLQQL